MKQKISLILAAAVLTAAAAAPSARALTTCQSACNNQHLNTVNSLWQSRPTSTTMPSYRQQTMSALDALNNCLAACPAEAVNLALNKTATAYGAQSGYAASNAVDGNTATYWWLKSTSTRWLQVDLGSSASVGKVALDWHSYYAVSYQVQTSTDGKSWTSVFSTTAGKGGSVEHTFTARNARYVRINCTKASGTNGYAVKELKVFAR